MKLAVDAVVFGYSDFEGDLKVLLIRRKYEPFKNILALPGGYVLEHERTRETIIRELKEETNMEVDYLEQLYTFSKVDRDPRARTVSVAYYALVNPSKFNIKADTDAASVGWVSVSSLTKKDLAFDHYGMIEYALNQRLRNKIRYEAIGFDLLSKEFTLAELHRLYSVVVGYEIDKRNFFKQVKKLDFIIRLNKKEEKQSKGPKGQLYMFDKKKYKKSLKKGINFWI